MKILVVDDSIAYRKTISQILKSQDGIEVAGEASHGKIALGMLKRQAVDLITLDMEMPELNGIETIRAIKEEGLNVDILVFAAQTPRGAKDAMLALELGALDIIPKPFQDFDSFEKAYQYVEELLLPKVLELRAERALKEAREKTKLILNKPSEIERVTAVIEKSKYRSVDVSKFFPKAIVIASSTGGPNALEEVLKNIKATPSIPILIAQHMPPVFTLSLAKRLSKISDVCVVEALNGEPIEAGKVYIAPGDYHMEVTKNIGSGGLRVYLHKRAKRNDVRPCANYLFESASKHWGNQLLGIVLTGMGADGKEGAQAIKVAGGAVIIQDEASSTVWGMPKSVYEAEAYDSMLGLYQIGAIVAKLSTTALERLSG